MKKLTKTLHTRFLGTLALSGALTILVAACSLSEVPGNIDAGQTKADSSVRVVSNRADLISGGDALIELVGAGTDGKQLSLLLNGRDVSESFSSTTEGTLRGLVTGLDLGSNSFTAQLPGGAVNITLINHANGGPVIAGPQLMPWACRNAAAVDPQCNQPVEYSYYYKSTSFLKAGLQPYDPANPATDVAETTTDQGVTLPFIVRVERGYIDRDLYNIAVLYQPDQPWTAAAPQPQFNHKLVINHGFGCGIEYQNSTGLASPVVPGTGTAIPVVGGSIPVGTPVPILVDATETALAAGFAVMANALDNSSHNCNVALQAESLMMTKERLIEQYGPLRYTIGQGCSGGSLAIQWIANAYPGIYQGILPTCSFPDAWSTATQFADYHLLLAYFQNPAAWGSGVAWLPTQMADVQGHLTVANSIVSDNAQWSVAVATSPCGGTTDENRYNPETNPGGIRCAIMDGAINLLGPRPPELWSDQEKAAGRGFAGFPVDNVGVQYGLASLQLGTILPSQFLDMNEKIGGLDLDTNPIPTRTPAVPNALENAYRSGLINTASNLNRTAIIDCRGPDPGAFHDSYRAYALRERLDRQHGNHENQLIWEGPVLIMGDNSCAVNSFVAMDRWLSAVEQDVSDAPLELKIVHNKPSDLGDACFDGVGQKLLDGLCFKASGPPGSLGLSVGVVPVYGTPRMVAGDSLSTTANKCQLKPLDRSDNYGVIPFSDAEWARMEALFADGVCDFSVPGVSEQPTIPWQTYQDAAGSVIYGGSPLPPAPAGSGTGWAAPAFSIFTGR